MLILRPGTRPSESETPGGGDSGPPAVPHSAGPQGDSEAHSSLEIPCPCLRQLGGLCSILGYPPGGGRIERFEAEFLTLFSWHCLGTHVQQAL